MPGQPFLPAKLSGTVEKGLLELRYFPDCLDLTMLHQEIDASV